MLLGVSSTHRGPLAGADDTLPVEDEACSCAHTLPVAIHALAAGDPTARLEICQEREAELYPGPPGQENPRFLPSRYAFMTFNLRLAAPMPGELQTVHHCGAAVHH